MYRDINQGLLSPREWLLGQASLGRGAVRNVYKLRWNEHRFFGRSLTFILLFNLTMRWSPLVVVSTVLAATSIFEVAFAAPIASTKPEDLSARSNPVKVTLGPKGEL